jgi:hypothetical protein
MYVTKKLREQAESRKKVMLEMYKQEEDMIRKIREKRSAFAERYCFGYLDGSSQ